MNFEKEVKDIVKQANDELTASPMHPRTKEARLSSIGNIYALYVNGKLKYIGESKSTRIKQRLNNHLFGSGFKTDKTGKQIGTVSKWHLISNAIDKGQTITFKCILIEPDSLRTSIEEELIKIHNPDWNIHG